MIPVEMQPDPDAAAAHAACHLAIRLRDAIAVRGNACIGLSGGATPAAMLRSLAAESLPWERVHVFQVDERMVDRDHPARNLRGLLDAFDTTPAAAAQLHPMPVDDPDAAAGAAAYAALLRACCGSPPVLDVVHLGLGDDGHTASLVPGDPALESSDDVAISGLYRGIRRMTLTLPTLDRARFRLWLVTGTAKHDVLGALLRGDSAIVATRVRRDESLLVTDLRTGRFSHGADSSTATGSDARSSPTAS